MIGWRNTRDALGKLEELLTCKVCAGVVSDPCSLEACDHIFCRACIKKLVGTDSKCPECGAFAWVKDMKTNRQLANTVSMCAKIRFLVGSGDGDDDKVENSNSPTNTINNKVLWEETQAGFDQGTDSYHFSSPDVITAKNSSNKCGIAIQEISRSNKRTYNKGSASNTCGKASVRISTKDQQSHKNKGDDDDVSCQKDKQGVENPSKEDDGKLILTCQNGKLLSKEEGILEKGDVSSKHPKLFKRVQAKEKCFGKQFIKTRSITKKKMFSSTIPVSPCNDEEIENTEQATQLQLPENDDSLQFRAEQEDSCILESENENDDGESFTRIKLRDELGTGPLGDCKGDNSIPKTRAQKRKQSEKQTTASPQQKLNALSDSSQRVTSDKTKKVRKNRMETPVKQVNNKRKILAQNFCSPQNPISGSPGMKRNKRGETPLHVAAIKGCVKTVRKLLQEGADPNTKDHAGWTPLHEACNHGYLSIVELLLDHGAMIGIPGGFDHDTPLHDAVTNGRLEVARVLVSRGAPLGIRNKQGLVPMDYAATKEMQTVLSTSTPSEDSGSATRITALPLSGKCSHDSPKVLLATGLSSEQKANLQTCLLILNAEIVKEFSLSVTHIVTAANSKGTCPRTIKYLNGVLTGKWIVKYEWIKKSLRRKSWLDEAPYEVNGTHDATVDAPKRARMNALKQLPGLFDGCQFYFYGEFHPPHPPKEDLIQMVKLGGGKILSREPKANLDETLCLPTSHKGNRAPSQAVTLAPVAYHANPESKKYRCTQYIIYDSLAEKKPHIWDTNSLCTVPLTWLMDCASNFAILDSV